MRVSSFAQLGGVNSLENFARSWQRAAGFNEIPNAIPSFEGQEEDGLARQSSSDDRSIPQHKSLLRQQLEREESSPDPVVEDEAATQRQGNEESLRPHKFADHYRDAILSSSPYLGSPFSTSYGGLYGSLSSRIAPASAPPIRHLSKARTESDSGVPGKEQEPLLVKVVEREDGKLVRVVLGQSTLPQTVFNSVNVLIGVGILSLPLGIKHSGWLIGMTFLLLAALATRYTAGLLARCLTLDDCLVTFADLAHVSFGSKARIAVSLLFTVELIASSVALVILFGDSLYALLPIWGVLEWKVLCGFFLVPLSFVPLRYLSITSVLGILCCLGSKRVLISHPQRRSADQFCSRNLGAG